MRNLKWTAVAALATAGVAVAAGTACAATVPTAASLTRQFAAHVHADDGVSVALPDGRTLYLMGDTTSVNGSGTVSGYGFPRNAFVAVSPAGAVKVLPGPFGYGWQQIPFSGASWYWPSAAAVYGGTLFVFAGEWAAPGFTQVGRSVVEYNATTLKYERTIAGLPPGEAIDSVVRSGRGWYLFADSGDVTYAPAGALASPSRWYWHRKVLAGLGDSVSVVTRGGRWDAFTLSGGTITRLSAARPYGPWTVTGTWDAGATSYSVHAHSVTAGGRVMVSWADSAAYWLHFRYLPF